MQNLVNNNYFVLVSETKMWERKVLRNCLKLKWKARRFGLSPSVRISFVYEIYVRLDALLAAKQIMKKHTLLLSHCYKC